MEGILSSYSDLSKLPTEVADLRGRLSSERVRILCEDRPWVVGEIKATKTNDELDAKGYDLFMPVRGELEKILGIKQLEWGYPIQAKSSDKAVMRFLSDKDIYHKSTNTCSRENFIFTFNGQKPVRLLEADMVGQMFLLGREKVGEAELLEFLAYELDDLRIVESWIDNRYMVLSDYWYSGILQI